ncbi:MAG: NAD(P)H-hydrate dehydratase [Burkholderiaceae bacterium]
MNQPRRLLPGLEPVALFDGAASRAIEHDALAAHPAHALMERAGLGLARLALAMAPHAPCVWVAAGPGNNGGDGLVAARWLHAAGKSVHVSWLGDPAHLPDDAAHAHRQALASGLVLHRAPPPEASWPDLAIDALLGLGQSRPPEGEIAAAVLALNRCHAAGTRVLAADLPTGLCGDTGRALGGPLVQADATLALLTAKPGLFTAQGRDAAGEVWLDELDAVVDARRATAQLSGRPHALAAMAPRLGAAHASHKGRFGDLLVVGGAPGMRGALALAGQAGLRAGAGRVYLCPLDDDAPADGALPGGRAELMTRSWAQARAAGLADAATVVCGCGGGEAVRAPLPELISRSPRLVLDADALNAVAADAGLAGQLQARGRRGAATVLTPHPLEAARLLGCDTASLQADRCGAAQRLADRFVAVVVLKGSGSVIAAPGAVPLINPTGNARLASAGTGDVLAGWIGGCWSTHADAGATAALATAATVAAGSAWLHGWASQQAACQAGLPLPAGMLIDAMVDAAVRLP